MPPSIKHPSYRPKFKISAPLEEASHSPPLPPFWGQVMRQQRMYSFRHVAVDLYIVSVYERIGEHVEHVKY